MKKIIASITIVFVALLLVGCGNSTYEVKFNADGGTPTPETQTIKKGGVVVVPAVEPTKEGFTFEFWMKDNQAYAFSTEVTGDFVLKASWKATDGDGNGGGDEKPENLIADFDIKGLAAATGYVSTATEFAVKDKVSNADINFSRIHAQINSGDSTELGVILTVRGKNNWESPSVQTVTAVEGIKSVELNYTVWGVGVARNLEFVEGVYVQSSADGTTWNEGTDIKADFQDEAFFNATKTVDVPEGTKYVRIFVKSAGVQQPQQDYWSFRLVVQSLKFFS